MSMKAFHYVTGTLFSIITLVHLCRLVFAWRVNIGLLHVPTWVSWVGVILAGYLAYTAFSLASKK